MSMALTGNVRLAGCALVVAGASLGGCSGAATNDVTRPESPAAASEAPAPGVGPDQPADAGDATAGDTTTSPAATIPPAPAGAATPGVGVSPGAEDPAAAAGIPIPRPLDLTPAQSEGPFYPVRKPADRDNDLLAVEGVVGAPDGEPLHLKGLVLDETGAPVVGAVVEIWQVDSRGIYLHPNDPGVTERDAAFQGYGEATSDDEGYFEFLTLIPGHYGGRPRHIHYRVLVDGRHVLTSQLYFEGDPQLGGSPPGPLVAAIDDSGAVASAEHVIVVQP